LEGDDADLGLLEEELGPEPEAVPVERGGGT
jgi:hypothetical protein